jgi:hypothetical protein
MYTFTQLYVREAGMSEKMELVAEDCRKTAEIYRKGIHTNVSPESVALMYERVAFNIDAALRASSPTSFPWDAHSNRSEPRVELRAHVIYDDLPYSGWKEQKPAWVPGGNSMMQDEARRVARNKLRAEGYEATASSPAQEPVTTEPVAWRHKHFQNEPWQYHEHQTYGTPYPYYEPLYAISASSQSVADQVMGDIEKRFPNWKSYRDLIDCIDVTLHQLRDIAIPAPPQPGRESIVAALNDKTLGQLATIFHPKNVWPGKSYADAVADVLVAALTGEPK